MKINLTKKEETYIQSFVDERLRWGELSDWEFEILTGLHNKISKVKR